MLVWGEGCVEKACAGMCGRECLPAACLPRRICQACLPRPYGSVPLPPPPQMQNCPHPGKCPAFFSQNPITPIKARHACKGRQKKQKVQNFKNR